MGKYDILYGRGWGIKDAGFHNSYGDIYSMKVKKTDKGLSFSWIKSNTGGSKVPYIRFISEKEAKAFCDWYNSSPKATTKVTFYKSKVEQYIELLEKRDNFKIYACIPGQVFQEVPAFENGKITYVPQKLDTLNDNELIERIARYWKQGQWSIKGLRPYVEIGFVNDTKDKDKLGYYFSGSQKYLSILGSGTNLNIIFSGWKDNTTFYFNAPKAKVLRDLKDIYGYTYNQMSEIISSILDNINKSGASSSKFSYLGLIGDSTRGEKSDFDNGFKLTFGWSNDLDYNIVLASFSAEELRPFVQENGIEELLIELLGEVVVELEQREIDVTQKLHDELKLNPDKIISIFNSTADKFDAETAVDVIESLQEDKVELDIQEENDSELLTHFVNDWRNDLSLDPWSVFLPEYSYSENLIFDFSGQKGLDIDRSSTTLNFFTITAPAVIIRSNKNNNFSDFYMMTNVMTYDQLGNFKETFVKEINKLLGNNLVAYMQVHKDKLILRFDTKLGKSLNKMRFDIVQYTAAELREKLKDIPDTTKLLGKLINSCDKILKAESPEQKHQRAEEIRNFYGIDEEKIIQIFNELYDKLVSDKVGVIESKEKDTRGLFHDLYDEGYSDIGE